MVWMYLELLGNHGRRGPPPPAKRRSFRLVVDGGPSLKCGGTTWWYCRSSLGKKEQEHSKVPFYCSL